MDALTYSVPEAARLLGVSSRLVYNLVEKGEIRSVRLGARVLIPRSAVADIVGAS